MLIPSMLKKTKATLERKITRRHLTLKEWNLNSKDEPQEVKGLCKKFLKFNYKYRHGHESLLT